MSNFVFGGSAQPQAPLVGEPAVLLCYGSCVHCGWWCACPEGGHWPDCPSCGANRETIKPARLSTFDPEAYQDLPGGEPKAFVAQFMPERLALEELIGRKPYVEGEWAERQTELQQAEKAETVEPHLGDRWAARMSGVCRDEAIELPAEAKYDAAVALFYALEEPPGHHLRDTHQCEELAEKALSAALPTIHAEQSERLEAVLEKAITEFEQRAEGCREVGTAPEPFIYAATYLRELLEHEVAHA